MSEETLIPTPEQIEAGMLQKEAEAQKQEVNPLDTHATLFYLYFPRFQNQLQFMSKKQLVKLAQSLAGSAYNRNEDVTFFGTLAQNMNLNAIIRVISAVIEHPLNASPFKLIGKKEQKLFRLFDDLLVNKYMECIKMGLEKKEVNPESIKEIEDVIFHTHDEKEFKSRSQVEKDAFATASKLLCSKFLMMLTTFLEEQKRIEEIDRDKLVMEAGEKVLEDHREVFEKLAEHEKEEKNNGK